MDEATISRTVMVEAEAADRPKRVTTQARMSVTRAARMLLSETGQSCKAC